MTAKYILIVPPSFYYQAVELVLNNAEDAKHFDLIDGELWWFGTKCFVNDMVYDC